jgi:outer membrane murein-binding lipoprotein Lpp
MASDPKYDKLETKIDKIEDKIDTLVEAMDGKLNDKLNEFYTRMGAHFADCRELCLTKINVADATANKAHERLDRQKESIECLDGFKNSEQGFRRAISFGMAVITIVLTYVGLKEMQP